MQQESYDKAEGEYEGLLEHKPEAVELRLKLGMIQFRNAEMSGSPEDYKKALDHFQLIRAKDPKNLQAVYYIATIFERLELFEEAIGAWSDILDEKTPESRDIYVKIAQLYERKGDYKTGLSYIKKAIEKDPNSADLHHFAGLIYNVLNKHEMAAKSFSRAIDLDPKKETYYFYLGVTYEKLKRFDECIESMKKVIEINREHASALNYLGYLYAERGANLAEAEKTLLKALSIEPDNGYFLDSLGWIYFKQGRTDEALDKINAAIRKIPPDPTVFDHLGDILSKLGDYPAAINAYRKSLETKPEDGREYDYAAVEKKLDKLIQKLK